MAERRAVGSTRVRLDTPVTPRRGVPRPHYDPDAFGRVSEQIARFLGTARFLVYLTVMVILWLAWNTFLPASLQFDPRSMNFTLLTLILSLQASYAAPLILLAQNRQADRDRVTQEEDRASNDRLQADVDYLSRELASLRQSLGEVPTRDFLREQLRELGEQVGENVTVQVADALDRASAAPHDGGRKDPREAAGGSAEAARKREDRERRAERKKRRAAKRQDPAPAGTASLAEPFVGDDQDD